MKTGARRIRFLAIRRGRADGAKRGRFDRRLRDRSSHGLLPPRFSLPDRSGYAGQSPG
jgi:hypothetical protein